MDGRLGLAIQLIVLPAIMFLLDECNKPFNLIRQRIVFIQDIVIKREEFKLFYCEKLK